MMDDFEQLKEERKQSKVPIFPVDDLLFMFVWMPLGIIGFVAVLFWAGRKLGLDYRLFIGIGMAFYVIMVTVRGFYRLIMKRKYRKMDGLLMKSVDPSMQKVSFSREDEKVASSADLFKAAEETYDEAVEIVKKHGKVSTELLQRKLHIGYARTVRLIDLMEDRGVVGPRDGNSVRKLL